MVNRRTWFLIFNLGCSSEFAVFFENGPFRFVKNNLTLNEYSWNKISNIVYLDFPPGEGFSYSFDKEFNYT